ncbi:MAG: hypothetical protein ABUT39_28865 [Acidobacteriota bacterium]
MSNHYRWIAIVGALLLAAMVGFAAYQAGVERGLEQSGRIVAPPAGANPYPYPYPYPYYGWHRPWGFGFFFPFFFLFWFLVARGLFWRRRAWYGGGCGPYQRFEEWHRQAHERDAGDAGGPNAPGGPGER